MRVQEFFVGWLDIFFIDPLSWVGGSNIAKKKLHISNIISVIYLKWFNGQSQFSNFSLLTFFSPLAHIVHLHSIPIIGNFRRVAMATVVLDTVPTVSM